MKIKDPSGLAAPDLTETHDGLIEEASTEEAAPEKAPELSPLEELADAMKDLPNAPTLLDLEQLKSNFGQLHASSVLADENLYLWRTLKRGEYKQIAESGAMNTEDRYQDAVLRKCLIYPKPSMTWFPTQDAGTIPTLFKQVMHKSGFVSEEMALALINTI
jgi:hypothetical protein